MSRLRAILSVARLDFAEVVRSQWLASCLVAYAVLGGLFVLVGLRESSVLDFSGMGRVLFSLCHALLFLLPLVALALTGQTLNRARSEGALELFMSYPIPRTDYFLAVTAVRTAALILPLVAILVLLGALGAFGFGQPIPWPFVLRSAAVCSALLFAFAALGIAISTSVRSPARALTLLVVAWMASVALLDFALIGLLLQWRVQPQAVFLLAVTNPVQAARMALLSAAEPDLATLGPVGFYLANELGRPALFAIGVGWPLAFGLLVWGAALRAFRRGDLV